jgi:hypothetical protein
MAMSPSCTPEVLPHRHAEHSEQEHADGNRRKQPVGNVCVDAGFRYGAPPAGLSKAVDPHDAERREKRDHQNRKGRWAPLMPDEIEELGTGDAVQHLGWQVTDDEGRTHEIGGKTDHQNQGEYRDRQRAGEWKRHRRHHEDRHDVIHEHRDDARQNRKDHDEQAGAAAWT